MQTQRADLTGLNFNECWQVKLQGKNNSPISARQADGLLALVVFWPVICANLK